MVRIVILCIEIICEKLILANVIPAYEKSPASSQVLLYCVRPIPGPWKIRTQTIHARGINYHHALIKVVLEHPVRGNSSLQHIPVVIVESEIFQKILIIQRSRIGMT